MFNFSGIWIPLVTPFSANGAVDHDALRRLIGLYADAGVAGVVALGTTGEPSSLEPGEQEAGAAPGTGRCALLADVQAEREWVADHLHQRYQQAVGDGVAPPTAAVLVRRNADAAPMAAALRARGIPVEVVGLAGLLSLPEVADVVAMLRLVADPGAGAAAMRVLTGPRWRLAAL